MSESINEVAIEFKNVNFTYGSNYHENQLLSNISFQIPFPGCSLLLGETGSGKSSILSMIKGLIPFIKPGKYSGDIYVWGEKITNQNVISISKNVGLLTQDPEMLSIESNLEADIAFTLENLNYSRKSIIQTISHLKSEYPLIKKYINFSPNNLSAGENLLYQIILTFVNSPRIILLDEPLSFLDYKEKLLFIDLISKHRKNSTILICTHDIELLLPICKNIIVIDKKNRRIAFSGPKELFLSNIELFPWLKQQLE